MASQNVPAKIYEQIRCLGYGPPHWFKRCTTDKTRRMCDKCRTKQDYLTRSVSPQMLQPYSERDEA